VPVNVLCGSAPSFSVADLGAAGVRRISVGSAFARAALGGLLRAAHEVRDAGTFEFAADAPAFAEVSALMRARPAPVRA
jgi:2-methylisocitrate lyase-like PEP mutase family enzyme